MEEKEVETFVKAGLALQSDEAYTAWMEEKKLFAKKMLELKKKSKKDESCASEDAEAGLLQPSDRNTPIEKQAQLKPHRGRVPGDVPRTPRSKLTANADLDAMFEEVKEEPNLSGATAGEEAGQSPMGKLVADLFTDKRKQATKETKEV
jgi:hypothetical protein